jgi:hypothetical protein
MKKIVIIALLALGLGAIGTGCVPPPPRQSPKLPPAPPGGPSALVVDHNFGNLRG